MTTLSRTDPIKPAAAHVTRMQVIRTDRVSEGFMRVTLGTDDSRFAEEFSWLGYDHWFRLFLPQADGVLQLPEGAAEGWYTRLNSMPEAVRPVVRNYTIRAARHTPAGWEIDVDFVVHRSADTGEVEGVAAKWSLAVRPGSTVGWLDQGRIFNLGERTGDVLVVADESALPAAEAIARSLPTGQRARFLIEIPHAEDRRDVHSEEVTWAVRQAGHAPGAAALELLAQVRAQDYGYVYVAGEAAFMLETVRRLKRAGLPKTAIDFCAYWRPVKQRRARRRAA